MKTARFSTDGRPPHLLPTRANADGRQYEIDLVNLIRTLWRGKWIVLLVTMCFIALAVAYISFLAVPQYTATSVVSLQNRQQQVVDIESVISGMGTDQASVNTEIEVLRSRGLIEKLVDQLDLQSDPEFNIFLRPENPWAPGTLLSFLLEGAEPSLAPPQRVVRDKTVEEVLESLAVSNIRQSYVFRITARTEEPEKSALIADTLADLYISAQMDEQFAATENATEWLTRRVVQLKSELGQAQRAVQQFSAEMDLINPERLEMMNRQLKDYRDRHDALRAQQESLRERIAALEAARESGDLGLMAEAVGSPEMTDPWQGISADTASNEQLFETRFDQYLARVRSDAERNASQLETMRASMANLEQQVAAQSAEALKLEQLKQEAEASRFIYEHFLGRLKEISVQEGIQQPEARVLSYAMLPVAPSSPKSMLLVLLSIVLGLFAGSALIILREMRSNGFRTAEELETHTGSTVIGQIPRGHSLRRKNFLDHIDSSSSSATAEAVRNLRTSILLSSIDRAPKVIMLTSSVPGEGKTMLSLSLAQNLSGMGKRVLVIEGDIRRRSFSEVFQPKNQRGLLTAVLKDIPLEEVVYRDEKMDVEILFGERAKLNAADFFSSDRFAAFLQEVRDSYDYVVIDTPPVLLVPDARVIAQHSDIVVYVVRWDSTTRRQVADGIQAFSSVNTPITGLVLSQVDPRGMKRYGYSGTYGKGYGTYSKKYYDS